MKIFNKKQTETLSPRPLREREQLYEQSELQMRERGENNSFAQQTETCHAELDSGSQIVGRHSVLDMESHSRDEYAIADQVRNDGKRDRGNSFAKQTETLSPRPLRERVSVGRVRGQRAAFTLAEVLITLGIIGVVAAIVLPSLITNINDRVNAEKIRSAKYKFTKATDHMKSLGLIGPYSSTDAFVDELQKYFKIAKRCDANHIRACWPTDTVKLEDGKEWEIAKTKTGKQLKMNTDDTHDYTSDNVAIITADGTPMILNYNKKCEPLDPMKTYGWTTSNGKPESNATAGCVAAVFEINGTSRPNTFRKDVVAFNANGLGSSCAIEVNGKCFGAPFVASTPMTYAECAGENATSPNNTTEAGSYAQSLGIKYCYYSSDYWAGAVKQCNGISNMPTASDLAKIANLLYEGNKKIGATSTVSSLTYNGKASQYGLPEPSFWVWSGEESGTDGSYAYYRNFYTTGTGWFYSNRYHSNGLGLCLGE